MKAQANVVQSPYVEADDEYRGLVSYLNSGEARDMSHSELERELETKGRELLRKLLQAHLDTRSPGETNEAVLDSDGVERTQARFHERTLATVFGDVKVGRMGYGTEGAESLHPLDAELNLPPERYSLELRHRVAEESSKSSFDESVDSIARRTGTKIPKRQLEELVVRAARDFDAFYEWRMNGPKPVEAKSPVMVLSFDGKGVVLHKEDLREATRKAAERRKHKLVKRLSKGEKRNSKRMATVATVYSVGELIRKPEEVVRKLAPISEKEEKKRPPPEQKRVWASLEKEPVEVIEKAFQEAECRDPKHEKKWVVLVDGNKTQIKIVKKLALKYALSLTIILDIVHVTEYLWKAASVFNKEETQELEAWVSQRLLQVLRGRCSHVAAGIRRSATLRGMTKKKRKAVDVCANYLLKYAPYLRYDEYLANGLPIATGVIEGACRHLVKDRMDLTGARWRLTGAEAVLRLRALRASGDFDEYWHFHESREYERNHAALYSGGEVPTTKKQKPQQRQSKLHLVK